MVPITIISGYLGVGKTTLINRILSETSRQVGVLVNDFGALNIDADLIRNTSGITMELTNGCLCCQITDDMGDALSDLSATNIEEVFIEASGVAMPAAIAEYAQSWPGYKLAGVFNLVDVSQFDQLLGHRFAGKLVLNQIAQADILLLSKTDLIEGPDQDDISQSFSSRFNKPVFDLKQDVISWVLDQGLSEQLVQALDAPGDVMRLEADSEPALDISSHVDFQSAVWQPAQAVSREKLDRFLDLHPGIVRAKGWFNDEENQCWLLQAVGDRRHYEKQRSHQLAKLVFIFPASEEISLESFDL